MGIVIRQSIKSVAITLAGVALGVLVVVLSTRFFSKAEYGFTQNLIKIALLFSYLGAFGFNTTLLIYGQKYPAGHEKRAAFLSVCAVFSLLFSVLVAGLYYVLRPLIEVYSAEDAAMMDAYYVLFPLLTLLAVITMWLEGYLQSLNRTALQNFAREILARLIYIALILAFALGWVSFREFIWLYVLLYLVPILFLWLIARRSSGWVFTIDWTVFERGEVREIVRFSGYHTLTVISTVLILSLDAILLGPLSEDGLEAIAVYSIAVVAISSLRNPTRVIGVAATPSLSQHYLEGKIKKLRELFDRSALNMQIIGWGMFILVYLNIGNITDIMHLIRPGYEAIHGLILILMIGQLADMVTGLNYELIGVTKYYRFNFWIALLLLALIIILNFLLIPVWGIYGAAWATTIGLVIFNILKSLFLWKKLKMQPFHAGSLKILFAGIIAGGLVWLLPFAINPFADTLVRTSVMLPLYAYILYKWKVSAELNQVLSNILNKRRLY